MRFYHPIALLLIAISAGCGVARTPVNPSFPVTVNRAQQILDAYTASPKPLKRPLVIVGGFVDPGFAQLKLTNDFRSYLHDDRVIGVTLGFSFDVDDFRQRILDAVDKAFPTSDPLNTTEVDVIGYSMGGVAARYAAVTPAPGRRLHIAHLYTISSPNMGARETTQLPFNLFKIQEQFRPGSDFLNALNNAVPSHIYPVYSYVCLNDRVIGTQYAAVPGQMAWWLSPPIFFSSHNWAFMDPRIRADILSRLRDDPPLAHDPPSPLPGNR
jgi:pimeloyl-ACP methyl ester carboxylesterase